MKSFTKASCVFISTVFMVIAGFTLRTNGQVKEPEIILMGNPALIPASLAAKLPTGFSWTTDKDIIIDNNSPKDARALFLLQEGITNVEEITKWATENSKKEVYFFYTPSYPADQIAYSHVEFDMANLFPYINWNKWQENIFDFLIPPVMANNVPGPNCTGTKFRLSGTCDTRIVGGSVGGGPAPYVRICYMFNHYDCYSTPMTTHLVNNIAGYNHHSSGGATSFVDCMAAHHGSNFIDPPIGFTVKLYKTGNDPGLIQECNQSGVFCAPGAPYPTAYCPNADLPCSLPKPQPLFSVNDKYIVLHDGDRNNWGAVRHELAHQYGYGHCHMDKNLDQVNHCITGSTVQPGTGCNINTPASLPPDHRFN